MKEMINKVVNKFRNSSLYETCMINTKTFKLRKGTFSDDYDNAWFFELAKTCSSLMDIGANMGLHTMLGFAAGNLKNSCLVDANPEALSAAAANLMHNHVAHQAKFFVGFVSDKDDDQIKFWTVGVGAAGSMYESHAKTASQQSSYFTANTITVDTLVEKFGIQPDLIKVDVEGAEIKVLKGSTNTARNYKPGYFVEMHSNEELTMEQNTMDVLAWCTENFYKAYYLKEHVELKRPDHVKHRGRYHLLLLHQAVAYPESLRSIKQGDLVA